MVVGLLVGTFILLASQKGPDKGTLWKIEGNGIKTAYLLGTFHLIPKVDFDLSDRAIELLKASDNLVLELDMDEPNLQMQMMQYAPMTGGNSLKNLLSEDEYNRIDKVISAKVGAGLVAFEKMKPIVVTSILYQTLFDEEIASYELSLVEIAKENDMEIQGLETVEFQMSLFDKIPYDQQIEEMVALVDQKEMMTDLFGQMVTAYKNGDIGKLEQIVTGYYDRPIFKKLLLDSRNENWVERIQELSVDNTNFYAVGAGHLGGEKGLITLLRKAGYKVTPVIQ